MPRRSKVIPPTADIDQHGTVGTVGQRRDQHGNRGSDRRQIRGQDDHDLRAHLDDTCGEGGNRATAGRLLRRPQHISAELAVRTHDDHPRSRIDRAHHVLEQRSGTDAHSGLVRAAEAASVAAGEHDRIEHRSTVSWSVGFAAMSTAGIGGLVGALLCLAASPYVARLTRSVPDRDDNRWWTGRPVSRARTVTTAGTALGFGALAGAAAGWSALLPAFVALALGGTPLAVIDFDVHRLPNRLMYPAAGAAFALLALAAGVRDDWPDYLRAVEGAAAVFAVLLVLWFFAPGGGFGRGDVRLGGVLGAYLGWKSWTAVYYGLFAGFLLGGVLAIGLLATRRATMKSRLAFGPMLLLGALIVLAFGP